MKTIDSTFESTLYPRLVMVHKHTLESIIGGGGGAGWGTLVF